MKWILVNIGCIECGVSSDIVGVYSDKNKAEEIMNSLDAIASWRQGGENRYIVFEMPEIDVTKIEYLEWIGKR